MDELIYKETAKNALRDEFKRAPTNAIRAMKVIEALPSAQPEQTRVFVELVVEYPDPELCTYKEFKGKPYYSIKYIENGETYVGYGTYKPEVLSQYLREYFMPSAQPLLYGYNIEHLVYIANVMQKENITPKEVVDRLKDARLVAEALVEKMEEGLRQIIGEQYG